MGASVGASTAFFKYEGLGNDFIVVEATDEGAVGAEDAARLCTRRLGVGADGLILLLPPRNADCAVRMRVINADGSIPEMCGNGVRCVALHVVRTGRVRDGNVRVDTDAGPRECVVKDAHGEGMVSVDMGVVRVLGERTVQIDSTRFALTTADTGNPHAILFGAFARGDVDELGPRISTHPDFAQGTNVEFAHVGSEGIDVVVWERGVGLTLACGTGACAVAAAACSKGLAKKGTPLAIRLPGGTLSVTIDHEGRAIMRGPARHVFSGKMELTK
jgi:diaminopimelate epimerase